MNTEFVIDYQSDTPVYLQLRAQLCDWVTSHEAGTKLPSERLLAEQTGLNRRTISKAMDDLVKKGLVCRRVRGTFIAFPSDNEAGIGAPHPFQTSPEATFSRQATVVKFAIFENLPHQKRVWQQVAAAFNAHASGVRLDLVWLAPEINSPDRYLDFVQQNDIDLVMLNEGLTREFVAANRLAPLSEPLAQGYLERIHYHRRLVVKNPAVFNYAIPLHHSVHCALINTDLSGGTLPAKPYTGVAVRDFLREAASRLPEDGLLTPSPLGLATVLGVPVEKLDEAGFSAYLKSVFAALQMFAPFSDKMRWDTATPQAAFEAFKHGKMLAHIGSPGLSLPLLLGYRFTWQLLPLVPAANMAYTSGFTAAGVTSSCQNVPAATDVMTFLGSETAQQLFADGCLNFACLPEANASLLNRLGIDASDFQLATQKLVSDIADQGQYRSCIATAGQWLPRQVLEQALSPDRAAAIMLEQMREDSRLPKLIYH